MAIPMSYFTLPGAKIPGDLYRALPLRGNTRLAVMAITACSRIHQMFRIATPSAKQHPGGFLYAS